MTATVWEDNGNGYGPIRAIVYAGTIEVMEDGVGKSKVVVTSKDSRVTIFCETTRVRIDNT